MNLPREVKENINVGKKKIARSKYFLYYFVVQLFGNFSY